MTAIRKGNAVEITSKATVYNRDAVARALLDTLATRQALTESVSVDNMLTMMGQNGSIVSRGEIIRVLKELADEGAGDFLSGRRGQPTRFVFADKPHLIAREAAGEVQAREAPAKAAAPKAQAPRVAPTVTQSSSTAVAGASSVSGGVGFAETGDGSLHITRTLAGGRTVEIKIPDDLTTDEVKKIQDYIAWLAIRPV